MAESRSDELLRENGYSLESSDPVQSQSSYYDIYNTPLASLNKAPQKSPTFYNNQEIQQRDNDTLAKMENDPEVIKDVEYFFKGIGSDETTTEAFWEYMRDADWNLARGAYRAFKELPNLDPELKQVYSRLRERYDKADLGGPKQWLQATKDISIDVASDPTMLLSLFFLPWTGGVSLAARQALAQTAKLGLKKVGKSFVKAPTADPHYIQALRAFDPTATAATKHAQKEAIKSITVLEQKNLVLLVLLKVLFGEVWMNTYVKNEMI